MRVGTEEERAFEIIERLCQKGCKAYLTGGAVRDLFRGENPLDFDVVTEATPEQVDLVFEQDRVEHVGRSFEVSIVNGVEVAGFRKDTCFGLSDKNVQVDPADTIEEDLARRDLTINSMAFCPYTSELIDPFDGMADLENRVIRFTGDANTRIFEDPCRILRACRFLAKVEGTFEASTLDALRRNAHLVGSHVAPERISKEVRKVLGYDRPSLFFQALRDIEALQFVFPTLDACFGVDGGQFHAESVFEHCLMVGDALPKNRPILRLAGFLHDVGKVPAREVDETGKVSFIQHERIGIDLVREDLRRIRFSNTEIELVTGLTRHHMRSFAQFSSRAVRRLIKALGESNVTWKDWFQLKVADCHGNLAKVDYTRFELRDKVLSIHRQLRPELNAAFTVKDLAVNGLDVMKTLNIKAGEPVGRVLNALLERVLDEPELNNRETLLELIKTI